MRLPTITPKQQAILELLYRYRFLSRVQIQTLMDHKDHHRINAWLKDLREKQCVEWIYSDHFLEKTKPAVYYLGLNGIRSLKPITYTANGGEERAMYPLPELRKRYRESDRTLGFVEHSMLVADICIALRAKATQTTRYARITPAAFAHPDHNYYFLADSDTISPSLCVVKRVGPEDNRVVTNYLFEVADATLPRYRLRHRLKQYVTYLPDDEWESGENDPPPIVLLALSRTTDLIYAKRKVKRLLDEDWDEDDEDRPHIRFTTTQQLKAHGVTAKIWEEGRKLYGLQGVTGAGRAHANSNDVRRRLISLTPAPNITY